MPLGYAAMDVMENHLNDHDFFAGNSYSVADIALYAYTHVAEEGEYNLSSYKNIKQWFNRVESQASYVPIVKS